MAKIYPHILDEVEKWPINKLSLNRSFFVNELRDYTLDKFENHSADEIDQIIATTIFQEKDRSKNQQWKVDPPQELDYWKKLESELKSNKMSDQTKELNQALLSKIIFRYSEEIVSNFDPSTFRRMRRILTFLFKRLFSTASKKGYKRLWGNKYQLFDRMHLEGDVEHFRALHDRGTIVIVPTHFSNLDSILIGYAMDALAGVPAFSFGAGLNLYDQEILAYFINRLGVYKVDRRKKNQAYLETLKSFSALSSKKGINTIFFPGGTRSRDGRIEDKVKLGLMGTLIEAQRKLGAESSDKKVFIVPMVLGYHFVLEADQLIEQHLKRTGQEKYLKSTAKPTSIRKISGFLWDLFFEASEIHLSLGAPMDVFGNEVDYQGQSLDQNGRPIDISEYFKINGHINHDDQRERMYTKSLGEAITKSFFKYNIVLSSHLVAFIAFEILKLRHKRLDIFSLMLIPAESFSIDKTYMVALIEAMQKQLQSIQANGKIKLSAAIQGGAEELLKDGMRYLGSYHRQKPLLQKDNGMFYSENLRLLYYYHNRLVGYDLEKVIVESDRKMSDA